jgi:hypothetical protein
MNIVTDGASAAMGIERYSIVKSHVGLDERIRIVGRSIFQIAPSRVGSDPANRNSRRSGTANSADTRAHTTLTSGLRHAAVMTTGAIASLVAKYARGDVVVRHRIFRRLSHVALDFFVRHLLKIGVPTAHGIERLRRFKVWSRISNSLFHRAI